MKDHVIKSETITEIKQLVLDIESLELLSHAYPLNYEEQVQLNISREKLNQLIKLL